jgi:cytochrome c oxidase assembly protein subunit 15
MVSSRYRLLAVSTCIIMLLVLLAGALVTNTGSGRGCGDDWPLCNGKFIPAYTLESLIEYSHRLISGLAGILTLATFVYTVRLYRQRKEPLYYAGGALSLTVVQALMGAAAVMWPQSPAVLAIHFGISLLAFACTLLLVMWVRREATGDNCLTTTAQRLPARLFSWLVALTVYSYCVVYLGAFIRHTHSSGGCMGWPLCNGQLVPDLEGAALTVFLHRIAAVILFIAVLAIYMIIRKAGGDSSVMKTAGAWVLGLVIAQIFSGALLTYTLTDRDVFIFTSLLHNLIISILFSLLLDMVIKSWKLREGRRTR